MSLDMVGENTALTGGTFLIEKMPDPSKIWVRGEDQHTEWGAGQAMTAKDIWPYWYNDFVKQRCIDESNATGGSWVVKANPYEGGSDHSPFLEARIPGVLLWHFTDQHYHDDLDRIGMVSAAELEHVGNCALATSLILTAGNHPEYARATLGELAGIAERRLDAEGKISLDALSRPGADSARERTIISCLARLLRGRARAGAGDDAAARRLAADVAAAQARVCPQGGRRAGVYAIAAVIRADALVLSDHRQQFGYRLRHGATGECNADRLHQVAQLHSGQFGLLLQQRFQGRRDPLTRSGTGSGHQRPGADWQRTGTPSFAAN